MTDTTQADPVGATEIATRCGIGRATVERWQERHPDFPIRRWTVGGRPAWDWHLDITPWLIKTNRMESTAMGTMWTLDTDATPGTVQVVAAEIGQPKPGVGQGGRRGTTVSQVSGYQSPPSDLAALATELRERGYVTDLDRGV